jgi:hypothetical protein
MGTALAFLEKHQLFTIKEGKKKIQAFQNSWSSECQHKSTDQQAYARCWLRQTDTLDFP